MGLIHKSKVILTFNFPFNFFYYFLEKYCVFM